MKLKSVLIQLLMFCFILIPDLALAKTIGLGAVIGPPIGLSANYFLNPNRTIHTTLAYDLGNDDDLELASHYTWRRNTLEIENVNYFSSVFTSLLIVSSTLEANSLQLITFLERAEGSPGFHPLASG